jgi:hypothetical protein
MNDILPWTPHIINGDAFKRKIFWSAIAIKMHFLLCIRNNGGYTKTDLNFKNVPFPHVFKHRV